MKLSISKASIAALDYNFVFHCCWENEKLEELVTPIRSTPLEKFDRCQFFFVFFAGIDSVRISLYRGIMFFEF